MRFRFCKLCSPPPSTSLSRAKAQTPTSEVYCFDNFGCRNPSSSYSRLPTSFSDSFVEIIPSIASTRCRRRRLRLRFSEFDRAEALCFTDFAFIGIKFECREFRESILGVMPHHWERREDTLFQLTHFHRHKRKTVKKLSGKNTNYPFHKPEENHPPGKDDSKKISKMIGKAAKYSSSAKTKKTMAYIPTITNHTQLWWVPNVVVVHEKEGIKAFHLATGRTVCKLHLEEGGLHADINGDGVLDHVQELRSWQ